MECRWYLGKDHNSNKLSPFSRKIISILEFEFDLMTSGHFFSASISLIISDLTACSNNRNSRRIYIITGHWFRFKIRYSYLNTLNMFNRESQNTKIIIAEERLRERGQRKDWLIKWYYSPIEHRDAIKLLAILIIGWCNPPIVSCVYNNYDQST